MVQPCYEIGTVAVGIMCHRIAKPTLPPLEAMLSAELVVRESSTPGRRARKGRRK
jgi:DNA-binding LacI/PurR family transcriptional regulator